VLRRQYAVPLCAQPLRAGTDHSPRLPHHCGRSCAAQGNAEPGEPPRGPGDGPLDLVDLRETASGKTDGNAADPAGNIRRGASQEARPRTESSTTVHECARSAALADTVPSTIPAAVTSRQGILLNWVNRGGWRSAQGICRRWCKDASGRNQTTIIRLRNRRPLMRNSPNMALIFIISQKKGTIIFPRLTTQT
jgi:hypothetical protein